MIENDDPIALAQHTVIPLDPIYFKIHLSNVSLVQKNNNNIHHSTTNRFSCNHKLYIEMHFVHDYKYIQFRKLKGCCNQETISWEWDNVQTDSYYFEWNCDYTHLLASKYCVFRCYQFRRFWFRRLVGVASVDLHTLATGPQQYTISLSPVHQLQFQWKMTEYLPRLDLQLNGVQLRLPSALQIGNIDLKDKREKNQEEIDKSYAISSHWIFSRKHNRQGQLESFCSAVPLALDWSAKTAAVDTYILPTDGKYGLRTYELLVDEFLESCLVLHLYTVRHTVKQLSHTCIVPMVTVYNPSNNMRRIVVNSELRPLMDCNEHQLGIDCNPTMTISMDLIVRGAPHLHQMTLQTCYVDNTIENAECYHHFPQPHASTSTTKYVSLVWLSEHIWRQVEPVAATLAVREEVADSEMQKKYLEVLKQMLLYTTNELQENVTLNFQELKQLLLQFYSIQYVKQFNRHQEQRERLSRSWLDTLLTVPTLDSCWKVDSSYQDQLYQLIRIQQDEKAEMQQKCDDALTRLYIARRQRLPNSMLLLDAT